MPRPMGGPKSAFRHTGQRRDIREPPDQGQPVPGQTPRPVDPAIRQGGGVGLSEAVENGRKKPRAPFGLGALPGEPQG